MDKKRWGRSRPNRVAAGMSYTAERSNHKLSKDALILAVRGTTETHGRGAWMLITSKAAGDCRCCGQSTKRYCLTDHGRKKLNRLRRTTNA